jgi:MFS family permease
MSDTSQAAGHTPAPSSEGGREVNWGRRIVIGGILLLVAVVLFFIGAAFLPRWWSHRIGDQVGGSTASGIGLGLFYGAVFTFIPLLALWFAFRKRRPWKVWLLMLAGVIVLAAPNLLTLGIVLGTGSAAHAGERTLDVEGPYFRASSLIGAIGAAVVFALLLYILYTRRRAKRTEARLRNELKARDAATPPRNEE